MDEEELDFETESSQDPQENNQEELQKSRIPAWLGIFGLILGATGIILALMASPDIS